LKRQYEAEQMSNAKLQQDMNKLRSQYEEHLQNAGGFRPDARIITEQMANMKATHTVLSKKIIAAHEKR